jgi:two-component system phosphate regulon sensor histidine kinase PhoR
MEKSTRLRLLSLGVIVYMLLAFSWWSVLLFYKNQDAFRAKAELMRIVKVAEGVYDSEKDFLASEDYRQLRKEYRRQEYMIYGEAGMFVVILLLGMWLINRSYHKEIQSARQRRNFLLSITHELKSPIASIRLVLETLRKRDLPKDRTNKLTESALRENERLHRLVNDLLLSARLESAYEPVFEPVNLTKLIQDHILYYQEKFPAGEFHFHPTSTITLLKADQNGLTSVLVNLLENAIKYSGSQLQVTVRLTWTEKHIRWEIADQGIGIPEPEKEKIFEKFYRVGNEDTRKTKGSGLGLFIVSQIIKAHGGTISVRDNEPQGTIFVIDLPNEEAQQQEMTTPKKAEQPV